MVRRFRIPPFRQEQCVRYRQGIDKRNCILAYLLLEQGLREQYGITTPVSFVYNEHCKPYLREYPNIFFNISHCKYAVACALADFEVGVDIQDIRPIDWDVARRVCSENELRELEKADDPARLFCKIWTEKEAYAKAKGLGVDSVLRRDLSLNGLTHWERERYCITVCCEGSKNEIIAVRFR